MSNKTIPKNQDKQFEICVPHDSCLKPVYPFVIDYLNLLPVYPKQRLCTQETCDCLKNLAKKYPIKIRVPKHLS
jgi:hypothetical protein